MSITSGIRSGVISGMRSGVNASKGGMSGVSRDATSSKYVPSTAGEWTATLAAASIGTGNPMSTWLLQEASGNPADSIGAVTLTATNAPGYQAAVAGWARKAVTWTDASNKQFTNFAGVPNLSANSIALLGYFYTSNTPAANREIAGVGLATVTTVRATTAQKYGVVDSAGIAVDGTVNYGAGVRPLLLVYNLTTSALLLYTDAEKITGVWNSTSGGGVWIGGVTATSPAGGCLYAAMWSGTAAEFNDARARSLLQTLGWTVAW